jgi:hypothetical protein
MADVHPLRYRDDVEVVPPGEDEVVADIVAMMRKSLQEAFDTHRQIASGTHAKTHGVVTGRLTVGDDLPPELAQGLFAQPGTYEVVLRYSSEPGAIETDTVPRARGASLKVLDVPGEKLRPGWTSQDFLFNTWPIIPPGDANAYHQLIHERSGELEALRESPDEVGLFDRTPNINPVAHFYFTQGAFRFGDHVAKLCLAPVTPEQHEAGKREVTPTDPPGVLSELARVPRGASRGLRAAGPAVHRSRLDAHRGRVGPLGRARQPLPAGGDHRHSPAGVLQPRTARLRRARDVVAPLVRTRRPPPARLHQPAAAQPVPTARRVAPPDARHRRARPDAACGGPGLTRPTSVDACPVAVVLAPAEASPAARPILGRSGTAAAPAGAVRPKPARSPIGAERGRACRCEDAARVGHPYVTGLGTRVALARTGSATRRLGCSPMGVEPTSIRGPSCRPLCVFIQLADHRGTCVVHNDRGDSAPRARENEGAP